MVEDTKDPLQSDSPVDRPVGETERQCLPDAPGMVTLQPTGV